MVEDGEKKRKEAIMEDLHEPCVLCIEVLALAWSYSDDRHTEQPSHAITASHGE